MSWNEKTDEVNQLELQATNSAQTMSDLAFCLGRIVRLSEWFTQYLIEDTTTRTRKKKCVHALWRLNLVQNKLGRRFASGDVGLEKSGWQIIVCQNDIDVRNYLDEERLLHHQCHIVALTNNRGPSYPPKFLIFHLS